LTPEATGEGGAGHVKGLIARGVNVESDAASSQSPIRFLVPLAKYHRDERKPYSSRRQIHCTSSDRQNRLAALSDRQHQTGNSKQQAGKRDSEQDKDQDQVIAFRYHETSVKDSGYHRREARYRAKNPRPILTRGHGQRFGIGIVPAAHRIPLAAPDE
jgi:hypothetical protein